MKKLLFILLIAVSCTEEEKFCFECEKIEQTYVWYAFEKNDTSTQVLCDYTLDEIRRYESENTFGREYEVYFGTTRKYRDAWDSTKTVCKKYTE